MIIFPAIDIKDATCVRLYKGDFATAHKVADDPFSTAEKFKLQGASWVHMVDLDGAKGGTAKNSEIFIEIAKNSGLKVELGGGIRNMKTVEYYIESGISRIILGSAAISNPDFVSDATRNYPDHIAVGIDAKDGMACGSGWIDKSDISYLELAKRMEDIGVNVIIYTDISKDGMLAGPSFEHYTNLMNTVSCDITASGGISCIDDIKKLESMSMYGAICGKSIYEGTLDLSEAIFVGEGK